MKTTNNTKNLDLNPGTFEYFGTAKVIFLGDSAGLLDTKMRPNYNFTKLQGNFPDVIIWVLCGWGKLYYVNQ